MICSNKTILPEIEARSLKKLRLLSSRPGLYKCICDNTFAPVLNGSDYVCVSKKMVSDPLISSTLSPPTLPSPPPTTGQASRPPSTVSPDSTLLNRRDALLIFLAVVGILLLLVLAGLCWRQVKK